MRIRKDTETLPENVINTAARMSDAFAHPARIGIYQYILKCNRDRIPVRNKEIVSAFPYSQATISQHLSKLVIGGLITAKQEGSSFYYYINIGAVGKYIDILKQL